jgi:2-oxoglutarate ferredoxin oxidoreductase subunit alpha
MNPFPRNLGNVLEHYKRVLVPEINLGQLSMLIRAKFLVDALSYGRVRGKPFRIAEIVEAAEAALRGELIGGGQIA